MPVFFAFWRICVAEVPLYYRKDPSDLEALCSERHTLTRDKDKGIREKEEG
jgi:hypothetical protein